jgi:diguanylate cyclase (GGDEF)-like protein/PAS domain S-box-containing protein
MVEDNNIFNGHDLLQMLGDITPDLIYAKDTKGRFIFANLSISQLMGVRKPDELLGKTDFDFYAQEIAQGFFDDEQTVMRTEMPLLDQEECVTDSASGELCWFLTTKVPLRGDCGNIIGIFGIARNITQRKLAELHVRELNAELEARVAERTAELQALSETLAKERHLMHTLVDAMPDSIFAKDTEARFLLANKAVAGFMGSTPEQLLGKTDFDFYPLDMARKFFEDDQFVIQSQKPRLNFEESVLDSRTGEIRWLSTSKVPVWDDNGEVIGLVGISHDITGRREAEHALRESEARFRSLTDLSSDWYWEQDENLRLVDITQATDKSSYVGAQVLGKTLPELADTLPLSGSWNEYQATVTARAPFRNLELKHITEDGEISYLSLSGLPIIDDDGSFHGYRGIGQNITERKQAEEHVLYLATHDSLTHLPNRAMFSEMLNQAISSAQRHNRQLAVLFIDLDRFKNINDSLGHEAGDLLLQEVSARVKTCLRASDVVARLGGDEFVILIQDVDDPMQIDNVAQKILSAIIKPMDIKGLECRVTASIGICMYPTDAQDEETIMKNADIAMYRAKDEGKNNFQFYSPNIKAQSLERLTLENSLRRAIERNEFFLHYQAKRDLQTGRISGVEALLRWQHPELGLVSPAQFIPLAEETGLIVLIGRWVLRTACAQNMAWQKQGLPRLHMAVNLSARQLYDERLVQDIADALSESGMDPALLEMEITEGMVMQNADRAIKILCAIKDLGVRLALDDFGVGYSSLAQIRRFPIDILKIDSSFIRDIPASSDDRAITDAIIAMGKTLSLTVVAEGVETAEQENYLRDSSCDESQGYYFSRPLTPEKFADLMRSHRTANSPKES